MEIDLVIDVVCPWCYVGVKEVEAASKLRPGAVTDIRYRPYQLAPHAPKEGVDRTAYYEKKFGANSEQLKAMRSALHDLAEKLGIRFDFESECLIANTMDAHRLIRWAKSAEAKVPNAQRNVADALMRAYFTDCQFLGDHALLAELAAEAGMDRDLVTELLATDRDVALVSADIDRAQAIGVTGVPHIIFDGRAAVSGAQPSDVIAQVIDRLQAA